MRSDAGPRTPRALLAAALAGMAFLHVPMLFIFLYAFSSEDQTYVFPPPGLTTHWFGVAWERPDAFRKVLSHVGSFTNIRGGHVYHALIRKTDKKPIRVFLQDGKNDLDNQHGNWWLANLEMEAALKFAGYDYQFVGGEGGHNGKHGGAILPDALRWLWRE